MAYVSVAVEVDPSAITQEKIDAMQAAIPGLVIPIGSVLYTIIDVTSERDAINAQLITDVTDAIWDAFGAQIIRVPRILATQATGDTTWTRVGSSDFPTTAAFTVPAGTGFSLLAQDGATRVPFITAADFTFAENETVVADVTVIAVNAGADGTGLQADPQPDETLTWLADTGGIVVQAPTAGGADDEDVDTYRARLGDEASLMARTLVQPADFAVRARDVTGVNLALALDLYDASTSTPDSPGHITVAVRDADGQDPGSTIRASVLAELEADSISILTVHVIAPTFTTITVTFTAVCYADFDPTDVQARAIGAVLDFLSPANWGLPPFGDQRVWLDKPVVRYRDVVAVLENVEGLDYTTAVTVNGGTADVTMTGPAALPSAASTCTGTVSAP